MSIKNITSELKEANERLAEILDALESLTQWSVNNAAAAIGELYERWKSICVNTVSVKSDEFLHKCENLLADCAVFQKEIIKKTSYFAEMMQLRISAVKELAGDNDHIKAISQQIVERWNETEQPQLTFLYNNLEELETSIRDMMEL